jgi:outer membrane protein OmpA-like peptidoglycan-associated protein
MRSAMVLLLCGFAWVGGPASAQPPGPAHSAEDFAKAIQEAPCEEGQTRDNGGACQPAGTRGFNLGARSRASHPAASPAVKPARSSMLDDLRITFRSGSAEMTPEGEAEAKNFAAALTMPWLSKRRFEIAGHTDASGSKKKNLVLSQARADAVMGLLVANGVDPSRLEAKGYGAEDLAVPSAPRDAANRRVEARSLN